MYFCNKQENWKIVPFGPLLAFGLPPALSAWHDTRYCDGGPLCEPPSQGIVQTLTRLRGWHREAKSVTDLIAYEREARRQPLPVYVGLFGLKKFLNSHNINRG